VIDKTFSQRDAAGSQPEAYIFAFPIGVYYGGPVPDGYLDIVSEPMDFGTVMVKLHTCLYKRRSQLQDDVLLIFENCLKYWRSLAEDTDKEPGIEQMVKDYSDKANRVKKVFKKVNHIYFNLYFHSLLSISTCTSTCTSIPTSIPTSISTSNFHLNFNINLHHNFTSISTSISTSNFLLHFQPTLEMGQHVSRRQETEGQVGGRGGETFLVERYKRTRGGEDERRGRRRR
jgi:hypothetical protein